jgi:hypothetical protein
VDLERSANTSLANHRCSKGNGGYHTLRRSHCVYVSNKMKYVVHSSTTVCAYYTIVRVLDRPAFQFCHSR